MLMRFDINQRACKLMLGAIYTRMYDFFKKYDPYADHDFIVQQHLLRLITNDQNNPVDMLLVLDDSQIVGHFFFNVVEEFGVRVCYINQADVDKGHIDKQDAIDAMAYVEQFARMHGAKRLCLLTKDHARVYERKYNFKVSRTIMTRELDDKQLEPVE